MNDKREKIAIIGLGYVGLPLAVAFADKHNVIGFDINQRRVLELNNYIDSTLELEKSQLENVVGRSLIITDNLTDLQADFYIVTVPTPTDVNNRPVLTPLIKASETVGSLLKSGDIVIYESTVYPGVTEEVCVPVLEFHSQLKFNTDFYCGYSPERINPGDKQHTVTNILKITSGSTHEVAEKVNELYKSVIKAGTFKASSIKVAEAAKVIENSQRDINIAFVNELSKIFGKLGIDTHEVLEAAGTKWNFLNFKPGLVGGHCIGVDPYYLAQKAQEVGYHPEIILAGRRLNDGMGEYVATETVRHMILKDIPVKDSSVLILGITFKENCPDIRNSKVIDVINNINRFGAMVDIVDPWANPKEVAEEFGFESFISIPENHRYSAVILAVAHQEFSNLKFSDFILEKNVVFDVKGFLDRELVTARL